MNDLVIVEICREGGFMKDYTLTSVITTNGLLPLSGPGNAYYQKGDETYRLQANWINGKKEGKAILEYSRSGVLLTISEYDPSNCWKNGHCFIFEHNSVVRCDMMRQGQRQYTYANFTSDTMTCFDEEGNKVYKGPYKNDVTSLFCKEGIGREFDASGTVVYDGLFHDNERCWRLLPNPRNPSEIAIYDKETNELLFLIHVNSEGKRDGDCNCYENGKLTRVTWWKNGVEKYTRLVFSDNEATEYASDGISVIYVGHMRDNKRSGEGTEYKDGLPSYVGQWRSGVPNGQGSLLNEFGDVVCEGEWRWGYLYTTEGWLDYASGEVTKTEEPYDLPLWRKRGGELSQKRAIEKVEQSIRLVKREVRVVEMGEWIQFVLYVVYAMIMTYLFTRLLFSLQISIILMTTELVLSLAFFLVFKCKDMIEEYRTTTPLLVLEVIITAESLIAGINAINDLMGYFFLIVLSAFLFCITISVVGNRISSLAFAMIIGLLYFLPPTFLFSLPIPFVKSDTVALYSLLWCSYGLLPQFFLYPDITRSFVFRFTPLYCVIVQCLNMMALGVSVSLFEKILIITGVFILLWLLVYYSTSDSVKRSLNNKLIRKEEVRKRLMNSVIPLSKPIPFSQKNSVKIDVSPSTKDKSIRLCICLLRFHRAVSKQL